MKHRFSPFFTVFHGFYTVFPVYPVFHGPGGELVTAAAVTLRAPWLC